MKNNALLVFLVTIGSHFLIPEAVFAKTPTLVLEVPFPDLRVEIAPDTVPKKTSGKAGSKPAEDKKPRDKVVAKPEIKKVPKSKPQVKPVAVKPRIKIKTPVKKIKPIIRKPVGLIRKSMRG